MATTVPRALFWAPRILCILLALFLCVFALDVFDEVTGFWPTAAAFVLHLAPALLVLMLLYAAWRNELLGALVFFALGALYLAFAWGRFHWSAPALISGPLFLVGALFLWNWSFKRHHPAAGPPEALAH